MPSMPNDRSTTASDTPRQGEFKHLIEIYAIRAREFYEAVAALGGFVGAGAALDDAIDEIERLRLLCDDAGKDLRESVTPLTEYSAARVAACGGSGGSDPSSESRLHGDQA